MENIGSNVAVNFAKTSIEQTPLLFEAKGSSREFVSPQMCETKIVYDTHNAPTCNSAETNSLNSETPLFDLNDKETQKFIKEKSYQMEQLLGLTVIQAYELWQKAGERPLKFGDREITDLGDALIFEEFTDDEIEKIKKLLKIQEIG